MRNLLILLAVFGLTLTACDRMPTNHSDKGTDVRPIAPPGGGGGGGNDEPTDPGCTIDGDEENALLDALEAELGEEIFNEIACDVIGCLENDYKNHGQFVSCMAHLTNKWKKDKIITGKQKGVIMSIAAASDIGKK